MELAAPQENVVADWLEKSMLAPAGRLANDLHIDMIDPGWKRKDLWLNAGVAVFNFAAARKEAGDPTASVVLVFSLRAATDPLGVNFADIASLQREFDWSPPALYYIRSHEYSRFYRSMSARGDASDWRMIPLDEKIFMHLVPSKKYLLLEFRQADSIEYSRTLHIIS